jgi:hypothetical protein
VLRIGDEIPTAGERTSSITYTPGREPAALATPPETVPPAPAQHQPEETGAEGLQATAAKKPFSAPAPTPAPAPAPNSASPAPTPAPALAPSPAPTPAPAPVADWPF